MVAQLHLPFFPVLSVSVKLVSDVLKLERSRGTDSFKRLWKLFQDNQNIHNILDKTNGLKV